MVGRSGEKGEYGGACWEPHVPDYHAYASQQALQKQGQAKRNQDGPPRDAFAVLTYEHWNGYDKTYCRQKQAECHSQGVGD